MMHPTKTEFDATRGAGLLITSLSISLDSLGVGIALPAAAIPLLPLLITVSMSTTLLPFSGWHSALTSVSVMSVGRNALPVCYS
jgi:Putative manganese efflux pump